MNTIKQITLTGIFLIISTVINAQNFVQLIQEGNIDEFKRVLDQTPELIDFKLESQGNNLLHLSSYFGQMEMVKYVIEKGVDVNSVNDFNRNAAIFAIAGRHTDILNYLIESEVSINHTDDVNRNALHWCAIQGNAELAKILIEEQADIHAVDHEGKTPLHWAARQNVADVARILLDNGANPNVFDDHCRTPLFIAAWEGYKGIVEMLVEQGAIVDARYIGAASPLTTAAVANHNDICRYLVENHANVNLVCNMQVTPIYPAVINNNTEMVDYYLNHQARINYEDLVGRSPLYIAVRDGYYDIVHTLIEHGADYHFKEKTTNRNLLHIAAANGRNNIVKLLVSKEVDATSQDLYGHTPLYYAGKHGHKELYEYLSDLDKVAGKELQYNNLQRQHITQTKGEALITKLRHKTWAVSTTDGLLVFGYEQSDSLPSTPSLDNGALMGEELKSQVLYHFDGTMSQNNPLYEREGDFAESHFINSNSYESRYQRNQAFKVENIYFPEVMNPEKINKIEVTSLPGFWGTQRSYLIKAGNINILWLFQQADRYYPWINNTEAIEYVKSQNINIDLLFLGNTHSDMGPEWINVMESAYEMAKELNAKAVFPMPSCKMGEYFYIERNRKGDGNDIYFAKNPGDVFRYKSGIVQEL